MITVRKAGNKAGHRFSFNTADVFALEEVRVTWEQAGDQDCLQVYFYNGKGVLVSDEDRTLHDELKSHIEMGTDHDFS